MSTRKIYVYDRLLRTNQTFTSFNAVSEFLKMKHTTLMERIRNYGLVKTPYLYVVPDTYPDAMKGEPDWNEFRRTHPDKIVVFDVYHIREITGKSSPPSSAVFDVEHAGRFDGVTKIAKLFGLSLAQLRREVKGDNINGVRDLIVDDKLWIHCAWDEPKALTAIHRIESTKK